MRSATIERFRRSELEARIEEMIALLDLLDGDPDLEDGGDLEPSLGNSPWAINCRVYCDLENDPAESGIADREAIDLIMGAGVRLDRLA